MEIVFQENSNVAMKESKAYLEMNSFCISINKYCTTGKIYLNKFSVNSGGICEGENC